MIGHPEQERIDERYRKAILEADSRMAGWDGPTKPDMEKCLDEQRTIHLTLRKLGRMNIDWRYAAEQPGMFTVGIGPVGALVGWCKSGTFRANVGHGEHSLASAGGFGDSVARPRAGTAGTKGIVTPRALDFFAGSGFARVGLEPEFRTVWANDICPKTERQYGSR